MNIEDEVRDLAARRDIHEAINNYMRGQDRLMPEVQRSAFHDDAYVDCGPFAGGPDEYVEFAQRVLAPFDSTQHLIGQVQVHIDGDSADGEVYFIAFHRLVEDGEAKDIFIAGRYVDRYERRKGIWKIAKRREIVDWERLAAASERLPEDNLKTHFGRRAEDDFSNLRDWPE